MAKKKYTGVWNPNDAELVNDRSRYMAGARDVAAKRAQALSMRYYMLKRTVAFQNGGNKKVEQMKEKISQLQAEIDLLREKIREEEKADMITSLQAQIKNLQGK